MWRYFSHVCTHSHSREVQEVQYILQTHTHTHTHTLHTHTHTHTYTHTHTHTHTIATHTHTHTHTHHIPVCGCRLKCCAPSPASVYRIRALVPRSASVARTPRRTAATGNS